MDDVTALTAESEALLDRFFGDETVRDDLIRIEAAAARRAIEGSGVVSVEVLAAAMHEASVRIGCLAAAQSDVHRMDHEQDAAAILAALPRPTPPPAPDTDRLRALEAALDHAEKNLGVIALTLTDHPEYPVKAADVDAARALARFTAQDIRAARALLAPDGERSDG